MSAAIRIDGRSIAPIRRRIHAMRERAGNVLAAWEVLADWFADQNRSQWGTRGTRWRTPWPELATSTVVDKRAQGYTTDILVRSRVLERSLTDRPLSVERLYPHSATLGTKIRYAHFHQTGTRRMPTRKLINVEQVRREGAVSAAVASWITTGRPTVKATRVLR